MPATKQISVRLPSELAQRIEKRGPSATYIIEAVREKLQRDADMEMADGFALLANSPEMWDMEFPTEGQCVANRLLNEEPKVAP